MLSPTPHYYEIMGRAAEIARTGFEDVMPIDFDKIELHNLDRLSYATRKDVGRLKVDTQAEFGVVQNFFGVASAPVIEKDLLIVQVGGSPKGSDEVSFARLKGNGSGIVAFDKMTGEVKYRATDELSSYSSPVLATVGAQAAQAAHPPAATHPVLRSAAPLGLNTAPGD